MRSRFFALALALAAILSAGGCATRKLPPYERPLAKKEFQRVRTTAYTHTESDHTPYGRHNAAGGYLQSGPVASAAADWSRWPVGTLFRVVETGEWYQVDDYGWALAGRNTIDLYKPDRSSMNRWGARPVTIHVVRWGDLGRSRQILEPRDKHPHVKRMLRDIQKQT
jgi:3D (Asp-Asp-Asp) domain-containing protein